MAKERANVLLTRIVPVLFLVALMLTAGYISGDTDTSPQPGAAVYRKITAERAKEMMDGDERFILLDVRTDAEFRERRISGAVLIPHLEIRERAPDELPDKDALIMVYCLRGARSAAAANELVGMGYTNVYDLGGIVDWKYETAGGAQ